MLSRMSSRASIVYIYTLMFQGTCGVKHVRSIMSRLSIRMIEEGFCHWNLRIITCSNSRGTNIEMSFDKLLLTISSNWKTSFVLFRRWLLEIVLMQRLVVSSRVLGYIYVAFMFNFKMISFKMFDKFSGWLNICSIRWMNKLFFLSSCLLKFVIWPSNAEIRCKSFILILDSRLTFTFSFFIKEGLLCWTEKGSLQILISQSNIALLQLIFDILVLFKGLRRCETCVLHCVPQATIPSVSCFINWLMLAILNVDSSEFVIEDILFFGVTTKINDLEISLSSCVKWWVSSFIDISF